MIQAEMSGPIPAEVPGVAKKGQDIHIPHATFCVSSGRKNYAPRRHWDNTVLNSIQASAV